MIKLISLYGSILFILTVFHFIFDWLFQTDDLASAKLTNRMARLEHSLIYALQMTVICIIFYAILFYKGYFPIELRTSVLITTFLWLSVTHYSLDDKKFCVWWLKHVKKMNDPESHPLFTMFTIVLDQIFHIVCLMPLVALIIQYGLGL